MQKILATCALVTLCATAALGANAKAGQAIYDKSCKSCHGADGTPNAAVAKMMKVDITDLKSTTLSEAEIKTVITDGKGKMKPVSSVTGASVDNVVAYVKGMKK